MAPREAGGIQRSGPTSFSRVGKRRPRCKRHRIGARRIFWAALPGGLAGQDADAAFYEAAAAWANLVMVEEDFQAAAAQADPAVAGQLTAAVLEDAWVQLHEQLGDLRSLAPKAQETAQGYHIVSLAGDFDAGQFDVQVVMNDDHGVAGFFLLPPS